MFTAYVIRHPKQFRYIRFRKILNEKVHRHKKEKSLFIQIGLHSVTISDVIDYILKAGSTSSSLKKKKKEKERKEVEKWRRKKGWKEFVRKERERGE